MDLSVGSFRSRVTRRYDVGVQEGVKDYHRSRFVAIYVCQYHLSRGEGIILCFLLPATNRGNGRQFTNRTIIASGAARHFIDFAAMNLGLVRDQIARVVCEVLVLLLGRVRLRERCKGRFISVPFSVLSAVFLPYPCFKESVVMGEGVTVNVCVLNGKGIGTQVIRRCRGVKVPFRSVALAKFRIAGGHAYVGRCEGGARMHRVLVVTCGFSTLHLRRIASSGAGLHVGIFLLRNSRRIKDVGISAHLSCGRVMLRGYSVSFGPSVRM